MTINFLKWDSDFFDIKIAAATVAITENIKDVIAGIISYKNCYDLVYIQTPGNYFFPEEVLNNKKILFVDSKVVYSGTISKTKPDMDRHISVYSKKEIQPDLLSLALQSGAYSRYKTDKNFKAGDFERLYTKWIENSVNGILADVVFVYEENGKTEGMVTVSLDEPAGRAKIGLIAVDPSAQKRGIGSILMDTVKIYATRHSIQHIEVATQLQNKQACAFYEKCDLSVKSTTNIYHFWLK